MRKTIILALAVSGVLAGGVAIWAPGASAQAAPPAPPPPAEDAMRGGPMEHRDGMMRGGIMQHGGWMRRMRQFALVYPARDKALSGADVQTIAEAFLLINGNHTWKITEVQEQPDVVMFAVATPDGTAIAHFSMDRHTARPERVS